MSPTADIKQCRSGEQKFAAAEALSKRLVDNAELVDANDFGRVYEIRFNK